MDQVYAQHLRLLELVEQVKITTYQFWINVYGPLFWMISAAILHWKFVKDDDHKEVNFTEAIEFTPEIECEEEPVAPWEPEPSPEFIYCDNKKLSSKRSFKSLKDQISQWKQKRPMVLEKRQLSTPSISLKEPKISFLRRFSTSSNQSSDCSESPRKKSLRTVITQSESLRKLKSFNFKLKQ